MKIEIYSETGFRFNAKVQSETCLNLISLALWQTSAVKAVII